MRKRSFRDVLLLIVFSTACASAPVPAVTARPALTATAVVSTETAVSPNGVDATVVADATLTLPPADTQAPVTLPALAPPAQDATATTVADGVLSVIETTAGKQVALLGLDGTSLPLIDGIGQNDRASLCGDSAQSPDGALTAIYTGGQESGLLHLMRGTAMPTTIGEIEYLTCVMNGLRYSPDGSRLAYLAYPEGASRQEFAEGRLNLMDTATLEIAWSAEDVVAFDVQADEVLYVSFFTDSRGEVDEAAVVRYDNSSEREIATLIPTAEDCRFTSASIARVPNRVQIVLVMGQKCPNENQQTWQFYTIGEDGSTTLASSDSQPGDFVAFARNNNVIPSPDGETVYFTVPDGITANTVAVAAVNLNDMSINVPVERQAVFPTFRGAANAEPRFSADRRWLAFTLTSPQNENNLYALDLQDRANPPILISAGARNDTLGAFAFTPDSARIIYVAGAPDGGDNSVFALDLSSGSESRVRRGNFGRSLAVSPTGDRAVVDEVVTVEENNRTYSYRAVRVIDLATNTETTLFEDTTSPADARVSAYPLAWLSGS
ncbi:MAG: hypothetical protein SF162_12395 [bacterium]|nr:hypothetical protein [bacterium]